ncbi:MAG: twin-arginine translocase TatA/TatE family subunit [Tidjanibacter sp.]|nr:twin-arginine translocase TatA/TatE family subunit [Tidjanibacter sp.]
MNSTLFLGNIGWQEIVVLAFLLLLFFGGRKIPELMRGLGKGVRSFKQGMNEMTDEIEKPVEKEGSSTTNDRSKPKSDNSSTPTE